MKILFDQNLSPRLVSRLADLFPGSMHASEAGLAESADVELWRHAEKHGFVIASKDRDFAALSIRLGPPPQVIWVGTGNCSTREVETLIRKNAERLYACHKVGAPALIDLR